MASDRIHLTPPIIDKNGVTKWRERNRTVNCTFSPRANSLAVYQSANILPQPIGTPASGKQETKIYFAQWDAVPSTRRKFITDTSIVYDALRRGLNLLRAKDARPVDPQFLMQTHFESCKLYLDIIRKTLKTYDARLEKRPEDEELLHDKDLLEVIHLPPFHGFLAAVVGRELMHWLNENYVTPTGEDGMGLLELEEPWLHPTFWNFIKTCTIRLIFRPVTHFLKRMASAHTNPATREMADLIVTTLDQMPSSEDYEQESDYFDSLRAWKTGHHRLTRARERHAKSLYEGKAEMEDITNLITGKTGTLVRMCTECGMSWREAICVFGIWVHPRMTRHDLPSIASEVIEEMPVDPTDPEELLQAALFQKDIVKAASHANDVDIWLVAHMMDILESLSLPEASVVSRLQKYYIITYAEQLMSDPSMWRIAIAYLSYCGIRGMGVANELLLRLPFRIANIDLPANHKYPDSLTVFVGKQTLPMAELDDILETCRRHGLKQAEETIVRVVAQKLSALRLYGKAIEYLARTLDVRALMKVLQLLSNEYLVHGAHDFVLLVDQIPSRYLYPSGQESPDFLRFTDHLHFVITYAEYHHDLSRGIRSPSLATSLALLLDPSRVDAPKEWWGLLLVDIGDLLVDDTLMSVPADDMNIILARLEEVYTKSRLGGGGEYLGALMKRYEMKSVTEALQRLESVRFILVHSAARSMLSEVGGKGRLWGGNQTPDAD
ncbi:SubName: Full=Uncharacterized protein {ECO:0000313/EMBL:CCA72786.1} [Serendipita indica DSM 11827]|nr:SubName: Full=Uncharacterized protein {ECO:0000313/EMBL:CCA72786.1} [Serendipita indica DSM 11827]